MRKTLSNIGFHGVPFEFQLISNGTVPFEDLLYHVAVSRSQHRIRFEGG